MPIPKRKINVLSIDFDYFQKINSNTIAYFPDGVDLNTELSNIVWASHYANDYYAEKIKKIEMRKKDFEFVKKILINNSDIFTSRVTNAVTNSHIHIIDILNKKCNKNDDITIYNIDMHHDMFGPDPRICKNVNLSCGNWGYFVKKDYPDSKLIWICNPISEKIFPSNEPDEITNDISIIKDVDFDIIFLCRSDNWTAPHLDNKFEELRKTITNNYVSTYIDNQVQNPRDIEKYVTTIKETTANCFTDKERKENETCTI